MAATYRIVSDIHFFNLNRLQMLRHAQLESFSRQIYLNSVILIAKD